MARIKSLEQKNYLFRKFNLKDFSVKLSRLSKHDYLKYLKGTIKESKSAKMKESKIKKEFEKSKAPQTQKRPLEINGSKIPGHPVVKKPKLNDPSKIMLNKMEVLMKYVLEYKTKDGRVLSDGDGLRKLPTKEELPYYHEWIKNPIDMSDIWFKIQDGEYERYA